MQFVLHSLSFFLLRSLSLVSNSLLRMHGMASLQARKCCNCVFFSFCLPPTTQHNSDIVITHTQTHNPHPIQTHKQTNKLAATQLACAPSRPPLSFSLFFHFHEPCTYLSAPKAIFYFPRSLSPPLPVAVILHPKKQSFFNIRWTIPISPVLCISSSYRIRLFVVCSHLSLSLCPQHTHTHTTFVIICSGLDTKSGKKKRRKEENFGSGPLGIGHWAMGHGQCVCFPFY